MSNPKPPKVSGGGGGGGDPHSSPDDLTVVATLSHPQPGLLALAYMDGTLLSGGDGICIWKPERETFVIHKNIPSIMAHYITPLPDKTFVSGLPPGIYNEEGVVKDNERHDKTVAVRSNGKRNTFLAESAVSVGEDLAVRILESEDIFVFEKRFIFSKILRQTGKNVSALAALPGGYIASGTDEGDLCIWNTEVTVKPKPSNYLSGVFKAGLLNANSVEKLSLVSKGPEISNEPTKHVSGLKPITALASFGDKLASGHSDGSLMIWNIGSPDWNIGSRYKEFPNLIFLGVIKSDGPVTALAVLTSGAIAVGYSYGTVTVVDPKKIITTTGINLGVEGVQSIAALPDGRFAVCLTGKNDIYILSENAGPTGTPGPADPAPDGGARKTRYKRINKKRRTKRVYRSIR